MAGKRSGGSGVGRRGLCVCLAVCLSVCACVSPSCHWRRSHPLARSREALFSKQRRGDEGRDGEDTGPLAPECLLGGADVKAVNFAAVGSLLTRPHKGTLTRPRPSSPAPPATVFPLSSVRNPSANCKF